MGTMYAPEFRHKALRMLAEARPDHVSEWAAITHVAGLLGINRDVPPTFWSARGATPPPFGLFIRCCSCTYIVDLH